jgi:hypothetical protein
MNLSASELKDLEREAFAPSWAHFARPHRCSPSRGARGRRAEETPAQRCCHPERRLDTR